MPIITTLAGVALESPVIRIPGLPDFNEDGQDVFVIEDVGGWWDTAPPSPVLVANGGGPGAVASGDWLPTEDYITLSGWVMLPHDQQEPFRRLLLVAFPTGADGVLQYLGNSWDVDKQIFVRRYDRPTFQRTPTHMYFSIPLVAPDPYKYALAPLSGEMGVFTGETWFETYTDSGTAWVRTYAGTPHARTYEQAAAVSAFPPALTLTSNGDAPSQRLTFEVTGPLTAGEWWIENESTGRRLWAEVSVTSSQTLVFDCHAKSARLSGAVVDHLVHGEYLALQSGQNTFRLVAGSQSNAHCTVSGLEAYL